MPECKGTNYTEEFATYLTIHCLHTVFKACHYLSFIYCNIELSPIKKECWVYGYFLLIFSPEFITYIEPIFYEFVNTYTVLMNHILTIPNTFINKIISIFRFSYCCEGKDNQRQQQQYNQSRTLKVVGWSVAVLMAIHRVGSISSSGHIYQALI